MAMEMMQPVTGVLRAAILLDPEVSRCYSITVQCFKVLTVAKTQR
jgi:hypothetical protein